MIDWKSLADDPPPDGVPLLLGHPDGGLWTVDAGNAVPRGYTHWAMVELPKPHALSEIRSEMRDGVLCYAEAPSKPWKELDWKPYPVPFWLPFVGIDFPDIGVFVVVKCADGQIAIASREVHPTAYRFRFVAKDNTVLKGVTHWHPLPKETDS